MFNSVSYDPDAQAFFNATGITNTVQMNAVNQLVIDLKGYNIWTKCIAIYPYVGGTATTHKFNLKNPLDTNAAFRIVWNGGVTHSSLGIIGNGTNGYGNTNIQHSTQISRNNAHLSVWSRTDIQTAIPDMGIDDSLNNIGFLITTRNTSNLASYKINDNTASTASNTNSTGFYINSRTASNSKKLYKNGSAISTLTTASLAATSPANIPVLGRTNYNGMNGYVAKNHSFTSVGTGLTDTEAANFYTAVLAFQTALGR